jgi:YegS/Rv2252/BmrU family lipid kinase
VSAPICLIVNPSAGGGKARRLAPAVEQALRSHDLQVRTVYTRDLEHARSLAAEGASAKETVVAFSGDGMIGAIADILRSYPGAVLGILPGGRGNDLARVLGIPQDPVAACGVIAAGFSRPMDIGEVLTGEQETHGHAFVGIASVGFDSDANRIANQAPSWLGGLVYAYGALRALLAWRPARFEIELSPSGERHVFIGYSVGAANSKAYGGGMFAAPGAVLDDGMLDVVALEHVSRIRFLASVLPRVFKGTHIELPAVRVFQAAEVTIAADRPFTIYADGDPIGELPLRVRALGAAVTVLVPGSHADSSVFANPDVVPLPSPLSQELTAAGSSPDEHQTET